MRRPFWYALIATVAFSCAVLAGNPPQGLVANGLSAFGSTGELDALIFEAATTDGIKLDVAAGVLRVLEGDTSGYAPIQATSVTAGSSTTARVMLSHSASEGLVLLSRDGQIRWTSADGNAAGTADTWLERSAAGALEINTSLAAGGDGTLNLATLNATGVVSAGDGTVSLPGIAFGLDPNSGLYRVASDSLGVALGGALEFQFTQTDFRMRDGIFLAWGNSGDVQLKWDQVTNSGALSLYAGATPAAGSLALTDLNASGQIIGSTFHSFQALDGIATAAAYATLSARNTHRVLEFSDTTDESVVFHGTMSPHYGGGTITVTIYWAAATATTGTTSFDVAWEAILDDALDIDADSFDTVQTVTDTTASVAGEVSQATVTFTKTQADEIVAGTAFRLKVTVDGSDGTLVGDSQVLRVTYEE